MSPTERSHHGRARVRTLVTLACILGVFLLVGFQQRSSEAASGAVAQATTAPPILKACPSYQHKPGFLNPDKGAPVGDYGDAPDGGHFLYPTGLPTNTFYPTLFIHGGAFTVNTSQEWLGQRVSREAGATSPTDPDGRPNLLYYPGGLRYAANLDCYDDSRPRLENPKNGHFYADVSVIPAVSKIPHYINVVADVNLNGKWDVAPPNTKEWVVRNCRFITLPGLHRIQCPEIYNTILSPSVTPGHMVALNVGPQSCPRNVWFRVLLTRFPITSTTIPGPWKGWDGHGPKAGFPYGEVEDYHGPCEGGTTPTPTPTPRRTETRVPTATRTPTATSTGVTTNLTVVPTATPSCVTADGIVKCTPTPSATPSCVGANGVPGCTPTPSATPSCVNSAGVVLCTPTPSATPNCTNPTASNGCTPTPSATPSCVGVNGVPGCTPTPSATPSCVNAAGAVGCTPTPTVTPTCAPSALANGCTPKLLDVSSTYTYVPERGAIQFCLTTNFPIYDLEWLGTPWTSATTGPILPAGSGWSWQTGFVGGVRAFTTNTPPFAQGVNYCFDLAITPNTSLPSIIPIQASNSSGGIIGYINSHP